MSATTATVPVTLDGLVGQEQLVTVIAGTIEIFALYETGDRISEGTATAGDRKTLNVETRNIEVEPTAGAKWGIYPNY